MQLHTNAGGKVYLKRKLRLDLIQAKIGTSYWEIFLTNNK